MYQEYYLRYQFHIFGRKTQYLFEIVNQMNSNL